MNGKSFATFCVVRIATYNQLLNSASSELADLTFLNTQLLRLFAVLRFRASIELPLKFTRA